MNNLTNFSYVCRKQVEWAIIKKKKTNFGLFPVKDKALNQTIELYVEDYYTQYKGFFYTITQNKLV